jgi:hypothetical protein
LRSLLDDEGNVKDFTTETQRKHGGRMGSIFPPVSLSVQFCVLCVSVVIFHFLFHNAMVNVKRNKQYITSYE